MITNKNVLILEEEMPISWALKSILGMENYEAHTATTLEEARRVGSDPKWAALITEYHLQNDNTLEFIKKLKNDIPGLYVMMLTNNQVDETEYAEIIQAGVDDYFLKPVSFNRILVHLEKALRRNDC
jgi:DNA-binding response OmpR family regulator